MSCAVTKIRCQPIYFSNYFLYVQVPRKDCGAVSSSSDVPPPPVAPAPTQEGRHPAVPSVSAVNQRNQVALSTSAGEPSAVSLHDSTLVGIQHRKTRSRSASLEDPKVSMSQGDRLSHDNLSHQPHIVILDADRPRDHAKLCTINLVANPLGRQPPARSVSELVNENKTLQRRTHLVNQRRLSDQQASLVPPGPHSHEGSLGQNQSHESPGVCRPPSSGPSMRATRQVQGVSYLQIGAPKQPQNSGISHQPELRAHDQTQSSGLGKPLPAGQTQNPQQIQGETSSFFSVGPPRPSQNSGIISHQPELRGLDQAQCSGSGKPSPAGQAQKPQQNQAKILGFLSVGPPRPSQNSSIISHQPELRANDQTQRSAPGKPSSAGQTQKPRQNQGETSSFSSVGPPGPSQNSGTISHQPELRAHDQTPRSGQGKLLSAEQPQKPQQNQGETSGIFSVGPPGPSQNSGTISHQPELRAHDQTPHSGPGKLSSAVQTQKPQGETSGFFAVGPPRPSQSSAMISHQPELRAHNQTQRSGPGKPLSAGQTQNPRQNVGETSGFFSVAKFSEILIEDSDDNLFLVPSESAPKAARGSFGFMPSLSNTSLGDSVRRQADAHKKPSPTLKISKKGDHLVRNIVHEELETVGEGILIECKEDPSQNIGRAVEQTSGQNSKLDSSETRGAGHSKVQQEIVYTPPNEKAFKLCINEAAPLSPSGSSHVKSHKNSPNEGASDAIEFDEDDFDIFLEDDKEVGKRKRKNVDENESSQEGFRNVGWLKKKARIGEQKGPVPKGVSNKSGCPTSEVGKLADPSENSLEPNQDVDAAEKDKLAGPQKAQKSSSGNLGFNSGRSGFDSVSSDVAKRKEVLVADIDSSDSDVVLSDIAKSKNDVSRNSEAGAVGISSDTTLSNTKKRKKKVESDIDSNDSDEVLANVAKGKKIVSKNLDSADDRDTSNTILIKFANGKKNVDSGVNINGSDSILSGIAEGKMSLDSSLDSDDSDSFLSNIAKRKKVVNRNLDSSSDTNHSDTGLSDIGKKRKICRGNLGSDDSDAALSTISEMRKAKRPVDSKSKDDPPCVADSIHKDGLKSVEKELVDKKCVVPVPRVSSTIVRGSEEGKRIIVTKNDEVELFSLKSTDSSCSGDTGGTSSGTAGSTLSKVDDKGKTSRVDAEDKILMDMNDEDDDCFLLLDDDGELPDLGFASTLKPALASTSENKLEKGNDSKEEKMTATTRSRDPKRTRLSLKKPGDSNKVVKKTEEVTVKPKKHESDSTRLRSSNKGNNAKNSKEISRRNKEDVEPAPERSSKKSRGEKYGKLFGDDRMPHKSAGRGPKAMENEAGSSHASGDNVELPKHDKKKQNCVDTEKISDHVLRKKSSDDAGVHRRKLNPRDDKGADEPLESDVERKLSNDVAETKIKVEKDAEKNNEGKAGQFFMPVAIKSEPVNRGYADEKVMPSEGPRDNVGGGDNDDDEVIVMYSQIDDTIWVSSDEEDSQLSQENVSFGPLPPSPDLGIAQLFEENSNNSSEEPKKIDLDLASKTQEKEEEEEDQWFPILSQAFWDDDVDFSKPSKDAPKENDKAQAKDSDKVQVFDAVPGPSNAASTSSSPNISSSDWWPELSQNFYDDDDDIFSPSSSVKSSEQTSEAVEKNLDSVIERLKNRGIRKAQLIDPKVPLPRTKNDSLRKRGRTTSVEDKPETSRKRERSNSVEDESTKEKDARERKKPTEEITTRSKSRPSTRSGRHKKSPSIREDLKSKYNLASYKAMVQNKRESHHLRGTSKEGSEKKPDHPKQSHLISDKPRKEENISIQKKAQPAPDKEQARPKVAAKITQKTRSEKLTEINLFPSPQLPAAKPKKSSYKIPKKSSTGKESETSNQKKGVVTESSGIKSSELSHPLTDGGQSPLSSPVCQPVTAVNLPPPGHSLEQKDSDVAPKGKTLPSSSLTTEETLQLQSALGDENKENQQNSNSSRGILKMDGRKRSSKKKVHFPLKDEDLKHILYISPRKDSQKLGPLAPKLKEVLPRELIFDKHNIPKNYPEHFVVNICRWNYDWLESYWGYQLKMEKSGKDRTVAPPPVVKTVNYPTLILYKSYRDYKEIFSDLFYLEVWENIYRDWLKFRQNRAFFPCYIDRVDEAFIQRRNEPPLKSWRIKLITLISRAQSNSGCHPAQGSLIGLKVSRDSEKKQSQHMFGYVQDVGKQKKRMVPMELGNLLPQGEMTLLLEVTIAKDPGIELKSCKLVSIINISYMRPFTRTWEGLCKLPLSPLCNDILDPKQECFMDSHSTNYLIPEMPLNECQVKAVTQVSGKCVFDQHVPKMSLIHGPPGTGKTRTIVSLVAQIVRLCKEERLPFCRILLCAPSNAAADELTLRLVRLREIKMSLRVVRAGIRKSIGEDVKDFSLEQFVAKQMTRELKTPRNVSARKEWERRKNMVKTAEVELADARKEGKSKDALKVMERRLNELARSLSEFEKSVAPNLSYGEYQKLQQQWQREYLLGAEVIVTTLGGSFSGPMAEAFSNIDHCFTCCIVDEAGQCKETEMWLPLLYGVRKLVLVGDHRQLPATVISQLAQDKNLKQSLFERLYHRFVVELQKEGLVHSLDVQYRMHPEIANWPSEHFYFGKLKTCPEILEQRTHKCRPYIVFDLKVSDVFSLSFSFSFSYSLFYA